MALVSALHAISLISPEQSNWIVGLILAAPHILYAYLWFFPGHWKAAFAARSVDVFATVAATMKRERRRVIILF